VHQSEAEINPGAADNILIAWPSLFSGIKVAEKDLSAGNLEVLDFGCGTGLLAKELSKKGNKVLGIDSANGMLAKAREFVQGVDFVQGDGLVEFDLGEKKFDVIVSVMCLQFIKDAERVLENLSKVVNSDGVIAFAIFDGKFVEANLKEEKVFDRVAGQVNMVISEDTKIPTFVHGPEYYDTIMHALGFEMVYADRPVFTQEFLEKYPDETTNTDNPEYLVLVYKKK
jgi:SAM-dependent methyltransferase